MTDDEPTHLSTSEVRRALDRLRPADIVRLSELARNWARGLRGHDADDLLNEAFDRVLSGRRPWPSDVQGFAIEKLVLVQAWREAGGLFDARERAALAWAETVTRVADTAVPDDEFMAASAVFSEKELADLTIAIGLMNAYNRLAIGFRNTPSAVRNVDAARCGEQE
jgi:hypothetical protein